MRTITALMYEPSFRRIEQRLGQSPVALEPMLIPGPGRGSLDPAEPSTDQRAEIAWASPEVFLDGQLERFMSSVLSSQNLRWLQSGSAGYDHPLLQAALAKGIVVTRNSAPATSIAEHVFAAVLDYFGQGSRRRADQQERRWRAEHFREVAGTTWLILGYGAIGRRVATRALAFEARVIAATRSGAGSMQGVEFTSPDRVLEQLADADVVVLALPLNPGTEGLVDAAFIAAMKPDSVLVNVSRGAIVDDDALLVGLDRGRPAHAVLDVFTQEPLPAESRYWSHPRVTLSCHLAGMGSGLTARSDELFIENLGRYASGAPLLGRVSP